MGLATHSFYDNGPTPGVKKNRASPKRPRGLLPGCVSKDWRVDTVARTVAATRSRTGNSSRCRSRRFGQGLDVAPALVGPAILLLFIPLQVALGTTTGRACRSQH
jgi:hypothetical protein